MCRLRRHATALAFAILLTSPPPVAAQTPVTAPPAPATGQADVLNPSAFARIAVGKPVRIVRADGFSRQGIAKSLSSTAMLVTFGDADAAVPFDQIARVEKPSNRMKNHTLIGLVAGVGFGVWATAELCSGSDASCYLPTAVGSAFLYGAIGAGAGVGVGALLNAINRNRDVLYDATGRMTAPASAPVLSPGPKDPAAFARVVPGRKVRITRPDGFRREGIVQSISPTAVVVMFGDAEMSLPFSQIEQVETVPNRFKKGAIIGLVVGAGIGLVGTLACGEECQSAESVAIVGVYSGLGAVTGLGIGALVHAARPHGDVVYDAKSRTTTIAFAPIVSPTRKGLAFTMTWR